MAKLKGETEGGRDPEVAITAYLLGVEGRSQKEISAILDCSTSKVNILAKKAKQANLLEDVPRFVGDDRRRAEAERAYQEFVFPNDLFKKIDRVVPEAARGILRDVQVISTDFDTSVIGQWDLGAKCVGDKAAPWVWDRLCRGSPRQRYVGVGWGRSLCSLGWGLEAFAARSRRHPEADLRLFPLWGEIFKDVDNEVASTVFRDEDLSASALARAVGRTLGNDAWEVPVLTTPAIIPTDYDVSEVGTIRKFVNEDYNYRKIFGDYDPERRYGQPRTKAGRREGADPQDPLVDRMGALLGAIGSPKMPGRFMSHRVIQAANLQYGLLEELVVADLSGALIPRPRVTGDGDLAPKLAKINTCWMGVEYGDISRLARRAFEAGEPGVICLSIGPSRTEATLACLHDGLINELIVDDKLAHELDERLDEILGGGRRIEEILASA
jgi:DNA-binding transcriptional regulator LsrR (DeoR family)